MNHEHHKRDTRKKHPHPDIDTKVEIEKRLNRIEGQIRGIKKMVEEDVYCLDILNQMASVKSALNGARDLLLQDHVQYCIAQEMKENPDSATEELLSIIKSISKR